MRNKAKGQLNIASFFQNKVKNLDGQKYQNESMPSSSPVSVLMITPQQKTPVVDKPKEVIEIEDASIVNVPINPHRFKRKISESISKVGLPPLPCRDTISHTEYSSSVEKNDKIVSLDDQEILEVKVDKRLFQDESPEPHLVAFSPIFASSSNIIGCAGTEGDHIEKKVTITLESNESSSSNVSIPIDMSKSPAQDSRKFNKSKNLKKYSYSQIDTKKELSPLQENNYITSSCGSHEYALKIATREKQVEAFKKELMDFQSNLEALFQKCGNFILDKLIKHLQNNDDGEHFSRADMFLKMYLVCCIQESRSSLVDIANQVVSSLHISGVHSLLPAMLRDKYSNDDDKLLNYIKENAPRIFYGKKPPKDSNVYEDRGDLAIWRWTMVKSHDVTEVLTFIKSEFNTFDENDISLYSTEESTRWFRAYGNVIKSQQNIVDEICKMTKINKYDKIRLDELEIKAATAIADLEKLKEKKEMLLKKRENDRLVKAKKEEEKQKREKQKLMKAEEKLEKNKAKTAQADVSKAKKAEDVKLDDEIKNFDKDTNEKHLLKQQNLLSKFFQAATPKKTCAEEDTLKDSTHVSPNLIQAPTKSKLIPSSLVIHSFESTMNSSIAISNIIALNKELFSNRKVKPRRGMRTLTVTVTNNDVDIFNPLQSANHFNSTQYATLKEVHVDNRKKFLKFNEDYRPPYWGTFSKRSSIISGRRPFAKDYNLLNYDVDSEAEWEEEDPDGEDIDVSDNEDDEDEGNDLVYDDVIVPDHVFDEESQAQGFIDGTTYSILNSTEAMNYTLRNSIIGIRYVTDNTLKHDSDSEKLMCYESIVNPYECDQCFTLLTVGILKIIPNDSPLNSQIVPQLYNDHAAVEELERKIILYLHGRKGGCDKAIEDFLVQLKTQNYSSSLPSKASLKRIIKEHFDKQKGPNGSGPERWIVKSTTAERYDLQQALKHVEHSPKKQSKRQLEDSTLNQKAKHTSPSPEIDLKPPPVTTPDQINIISFLTKEKSSIDVINPDIFDTSIDDRNYLMVLADGVWGESKEDSSHTLLLNESILSPQSLSSNK